ncbi:MAG: response regulator transcription factor [Bacteroidetes bacterium]|nr:response regulator transcription factor [Bacteroidota bacterium]
MKKLNLIIVDDEPVARKVLREFAGQVPYLNLSGQFENTERAGAYLLEHDVDLILLDIEMPKVSGLEWLKSLSVKPMVILCTAFPKYALEGYELDIIDYLLKPVAFDRFLKAVQKAREFAELKQLNHSDFLFVRCEKRIEKLELRDISYVESLGNYVRIHLPGRQLIAYLTLKSLENQLPTNSFIKVHQSYIVNFTKITAIDGNQVLVQDQSLPVSRNFRDRLMRMIEERMLKR